MKQGGAWLLVLELASSGCGSTVSAPRPTEPKVASGPLAIRIVYPRSLPPVLEDGVWIIRPDSGVRIESRDSAFIFGSLGRGAAQLSVNGQPVEVYPTGGWIAWLPLPKDTMASFELLASAGGDTARALFSVPLAWRYEPPAAGAWIDTTSLAPRGDRWIKSGEGLQLSLVAAEGADARIVTPAGDTIRLLPAGSLSESISAGSEAFGSGLPPGRPAQQRTRYTVYWVGPFGPDPGDIFRSAPPPPPDDPTWVKAEVILGVDTVRARWPLRAKVLDSSRPIVVTIDDDPGGTGSTDSVLPGRPLPYGTYHWFFPTGTIASVSGRWNDQVRLQLSATSAAWVDLKGVKPLPPGTLPPGGRVGSLRLLRSSGAVILRIPLAARIPFKVDEEERRLALTLYGAQADLDWIHYGEPDPLVKLVSFNQRSWDELAITVELNEPVWGYRTRWVEGGLWLEIRRPPPIDQRNPLAGRRIALDAGHPPLGAVGPTGVREADVTLAVARVARDLLLREGAEVVMVRDSDAPLSLEARTRVAERADAEILVSIHANALPDGVNPWVNNGTSVYYFHPRAVELARAIDRELVRRLGFRDLGIGRGDLALARPTWMPAVLVEGLFLMIPEQEAVLASREGQRRYAMGIVEGLKAFLRGLSGRRD